MLPACAIPVQSDALKTLVMSDLLAHLAKGNLQTLLNSGLSAEQIDEIRNLPLARANALMQMKSLDLGVVIDPQSLNLALQQLEQAERWRHDMEYFVTSGASNEILKALFKASDRDIAEYREMLKISPNSGRPKLPNEETTDRILSDWRYLVSRLSDPRQRFLILHRRFSQFSMSVLARVVEAA